MEICGAVLSAAENASFYEQYKLVAYLSAISLNIIPGISRGSNDRKN